MIKCTPPRLGTVVASQIGPGLIMGHVYMTLPVSISDASSQYMWLLPVHLKTLCCFFGKFLTSHENIAECLDNYTKIMNTGPVHFFLMRLSSSCPVCFKLYWNFIHSIFFPSSSSHLDFKQYVQAYQ